MFRVFLLLPPLLLACATPGAPPAVASSGADALRARISRADDDVERNALRMELARLELDRARSAHTVFAYRRFLEEFPHGESAITARALLESLRFEEAARLDTPAAWAAFLEEHPRGRRTAEAKARLGALETAAALASTDLPLVRRVLARHPAAERRRELELHEDALSWAAARDGGLPAVEQFLLERPASAHRSEAERIQRSLVQAAVLEEEDFAAAEARARRSGTAEALDTLSELKLRRAVREWDLAAVRSIAEDGRLAPASEPRRRAGELLASLQKSPLHKDARAALEAARRGAGLRPVAELRRLVPTADPLEREVALRELAEWGVLSDLELFFEALDGRYVGVRLAAVEAIALLAAAQPPAVWTARARARERELLVQALTASPWRRIAALRESVGNVEGAVTAWREVLRNDPEDLAASARLLALESRRGDRLAYGAAARELSRVALDFGNERWLRPPDPNAPPESRRDGPGIRLGLSADLTVLRQICVAVDLAEEAARALGGLRGDAAVQEAELIALALQDSERILTRMRNKRDELERELSRRDRAYVACATDRAAPRIAESRARRVAALGRLGELRDRRLLPLVEDLAHSPAAELQAAARAAAAQLGAP